MRTSGASTGEQNDVGGIGIYAALVLGALFQLAPAALAAPAADNRITYSEYANPDYGYSICYPDNIFIPQGETISRDGQLFTAKDGAQLNVHADYNIPFRSIQDDFQDTVSKESKDGAVTFKLQEANWYVVSGIKGGNIFYRKTILFGEAFITFRTIYPGSANPLYSEVVTALANCLKPSTARTGRP